MNLPELIAAKRAAGAATQQAADAHGIPAHLVAWLERGARRRGVDRPWRPRPAIVHQIAGWLDETDDAVCEAIRQNT